MKTPGDPESVVQSQLDAYNSRDIDALMAAYADDIELFEHPAKLPASGAAQARERQGARLQEQNLHAALLKRTVMGNMVIGHDGIAPTGIDIHLDREGFCAITAGDNTRVSPADVGGQVNSLSR